MLPDIDKKEPALAYKDDNLELIIGDKLSLTAPDDDHLFFNSFLGKCFSNGLCDEAQLEVKQKPWLECYFELRLFKEGKEVTENEYYSTMHPGQEAMDRTSIYSEDCDYQFLRYTLNKGAVKK